MMRVMILVLVLLGTAPMAVSAEARASADREVSPLVQPPPLVVSPEVEGRFAPVDECKAMPGATAFRAALADAVFVRKTEAVVALAAPDVKLDFGGGEGREELRRRLSGNRGPELWKALRTMLPLGCAVQGDEIVLPWFFKQDLGVEDPFDVLLVTGTRVYLRDRPAQIAEADAILSWTLVKLVEGFDPEQQFQKVEVLETGMTGYVYTTQLRSQLDYRLIARPAGLNWEIATFIAGD